MSILVYFTLGCIFSLLVFSSYLDKISKKDNVFNALFHSLKIRYNELKTNTAGIVKADSVDIIVVPTEQYDAYEKVQKYLPGLTENDKLNLFKLCSLVPMFAETFLSGKDRISEAFDDLKKSGGVSKEFENKIIKYLLFMSENPFAKAFVEGYLYGQVDILAESKPKKKGRKNGNSKKSKNKKTTDSK